MSATIIHAEYEKMVSDGDYGRERALASITYELGADEDHITTLAVLQDQLRHRVEQDLRQSLNRNVRWAMREPEPAAEDLEELPL